MIAPELVNKLQQLNREEKIAVVRLLQDDLVKESAERDKLLSEPGQAFRFVPPLRASDGGAALRRVLDADHEQNA